LEEKVSTEVSVNKQQSARNVIDSATMPVPATNPKQSAEEIAVLYRTARALLEASAGESGELLTVLLDLAIEALSADRGLVVVPEGEGFRATVARNFRSTSLDETEAQISSSIAREVLAKRRALLLGNAAGMGDFTENPSVREFGLRSVLCAPLVSGEQVFALLYLENRSIENCFSVRHSLLLDEICTMAAPRLAATVALERARSAARQISSLIGESDLITADSRMAEVMAMVRRVAPTELPILVQGETGTGKELVARSLYRQSRRNNASFVVINCAAIPAELIESELFGHVRGAFTGANHDRVGLIAAANRGTVFLDEIGELPLPLQPKLLRVLQSGEIMRLGSSKTEICDVRFLAATNRDLQREVDEGRFRSDLYFRIAGVVVSLPPLRDRAHDVHLLADHYLKVYSHRYSRKPLRWSPNALRALAKYSFPGNVRELESECARLVAMSPDTGDESYEIGVGDLSDRMKGEAAAANQAASAAPAAAIPIAPMSLAEMEKRLIASVLEFTGDNRTRAAEVLGISREGLRMKMQRFELGSPEA
jgi:transcriptional regulator with GAF, ATPase, and Fis domain